MMAPHFLKVNKTRSIYWAVTIFTKTSINNILKKVKSHKTDQGSSQEAESFEVTVNKIYDKLLADCQSNSKPVNSNQTGGFQLAIYRLMKIHCTQLLLFLNSA